MKICQQNYLKGKVQLGQMISILKIKASCFFLFPVLQKSKMVCAEGKEFILLIQNQFNKVISQMCKQTYFPGGKVQQQIFRVYLNHSFYNYSKDNREYIQALKESGSPCRSSRLEVRIICKRHVACFSEKRQITILLSYIWSDMTGDRTHDIPQSTISPPQ